eukprot:6548037-Alexandrium_andersonii.AAC.1
MSAGVCLQRLELLRNVCGEAFLRQQLSVVLGCWSVSDLRIPVSLCSRVRSASVEQVNFSARFVP